MQLSITHHQAEYRYDGGLYLNSTAIGENLCRISALVSPLDTWGDTDNSTQDSV
jgi:hypothetical protein